MNDTVTTSGDTGDGGVAGQQATSTEWFSSFDEDTRGWMDNKGLTKLDQTAALESAVKGFRSAEKYVGVPHDKLLRVPDWDKAEAVELDQFYGKLGRPDAPDKYDLKMPDGGDPGLTEFTKSLFHEAGLTDRQARLVYDKWNEHMGKLQATELENYQVSVAQQDASLRKEWGQAYDQQIDSAKSAARALGLNNNQIDAMEATLGFDGLMKMMSNIGGKIGEDRFVTGNEGGSFEGKMTPASAKARITQLQGDKDWTTKYLAGNIQAKAEMERLMQMAYPS